MEIAILVIIAVVTILDLVGTAMLTAKEFSRDMERRREAKIEEAMKQEEAPPAEKQGADPMTEGFENIMGFSVMGQNGFDREQD